MALTQDEPNGGTMSDEDPRLAELVATLRPLVASEEARTTALNGRALGVLQALAIVTALAGFFGKDVLTQGFLDADKDPIRIDLVVWSGNLVTVAGVGIVVVLVALSVTTLLALRALFPHRRVFFDSEVVKRWVGSANTEVDRDVTATPADAVLPDTLNALRQRAAYEIGGTYINLQEFNGAKVAHLKMAYLGLAISIGLTIVLTCLLALEAAFSTT